MINALSSSIPYGIRVPTYEVTQQDRANVEMRTNNAEQVQAQHPAPPQPVIGMGARDSKEKDETQSKQPVRKEQSLPQLEALRAELMSRPVKAQRAVTRFLLTAAANASLPKEETTSNPDNRSAVAGGSRQYARVDLFA
ncbi:MAG: hypothetical protein HQL58_00230 [Magnetococcales bacterium]|nr:hypothetical protein [Magnetococcales bacterium]